MHKSPEGKEVEEKLRDSEERFRGVFEQSPFSIQLFTAEGRTFAVNPAWKNLWQVPQETIDSFILSEYNVRNDTQLKQKGVLSYIEKAFQGTSSAIPEIFYDPASIGISGSPKWVKGFTYPVKDREGRLREVVLMHLDVTERRHAEDQLREVSERLSVLMNSVSDFLWSASIDPHGTFTSIYFSPVVERITGRPPAYFCQGPDRWFEIIHPDDRSRAEAIFHSILRRETDREESDYRIFLPSGDIRWVRGSVTVNELPSGGIRIDGVVSDITDRKIYLESRERLLEQETAARKEAEKAIQLRDDFLSIVTHELRTPLTPIRMYLQLVEHAIQGLPSGAPKVEFIQESIRKSNYELDRFQHLIERLLDVSRISANGLILSCHEFDLADLARNVIERLDPLFKKSQCPVHLDIQKPILGSWDEDRVEQVLVNLLSNAAKYGAKKPIEITVSPLEAKAVIQIKDHGIGIQKSDHERIFHRFERVAPLKHYGGFGLGLFICREIIHAHGGTITLNSELGSGSVFTIELPLSSESALLGKELSGVQESEMKSSQ